MEIYLDNAATTKVKPEIAQEMLQVMLEVYGNPSSIYQAGQKAATVIATARQEVADLIGASPKEIVFTGGGSEGDNMLIKGIAKAKAKIGKHIITTAVEHHAVLHTCEELAKEGFEITYLPVDEYGMVSAAQVEAALRADTILVSIMYANNEIGTVMPIKEIGEVCRKHKVLFHTDAVQAVGHIPVNVVEDNIDLLTLTAHKFHGPKGIGAVYIKQGVRVPALIVGGAQEKGLRAGTENTVGIVGLGMAAKIAKQEMASNARKMEALRDLLIKGILEKIPEVRLNGHPEQRLPNNVNVSIRYIEGEGLLLLLDHMGIAASSGSACTSGSLDPSHVLLAIGLPHEIAHGSLRLTLSEETSKEDIEYVLEKLPVIVDRLRAMSPLYNK